MNEKFYQHSRDVFSPVSGKRCATRKLGIPKTEFREAFLKYFSHENFFFFSWVCGAATRKVCPTLLWSKSASDCWWIYDLRLILFAFFRVSIISPYSADRR